MAGIETYYPKTKQHLRKWLEKNHLTKDAVWFIFYKKHTGKPTVNWSDAVDEALCFGWIDSKGETIDDHTFRQYFCKRKPNSTWSKINKQKIKFYSYWASKAGPWWLINFQFFQSGISL